MKTCWTALILVILCAIAIGLIGSISYNSDKEVIRLREQNSLLQEEIDRIECENIELKNGTFTLSVEIR